jgi:transcriptional regulator with XRE-family HTH domain
MGNTLGEFLNSKRLGKKITFAQLAQKCKMATPTIWKVIKDKARPKDLTLQALSEALDIPLSELFSYRDKTHYPSSRRRPGRPKKNTKEASTQEVITKEKLIEYLQKSRFSGSAVEALYYIAQVVK